MQQNQEITADLDFTRLHVKDSSSYNKQLKLEEQNLSLINTTYNNQGQPRNYYCYRHRPDLVKERMADELAHDELQKVQITSFFLQNIYLTNILFNPNFIFIILFFKL
jgi:hypothetical protein